jgi:hypothetical protein
MEVEHQATSVGLVSDPGVYRLADVTVVPVRST